MKEKSGLIMFQSNLAIVRLIRHRGCNLVFLVVSMHLLTTQFVVRCNYKIICIYAINHVIHGIWKLKLIREQMDKAYFNVLHFIGHQIYGPMITESHQRIHMVSIVYISDFPCKWTDELCTDQSYVHIFGHNNKHHLSGIWYMCWMHYHILLNATKLIITLVLSYSMGEKVFIKTQMDLHKIYISVIIYVYFNIYAIYPLY